MDPLMRTRFVVFDFTHVDGVDATAVQSCFLRLKCVLPEPCAIICIAPWTMEGVEWCRGVQI